MNSKRREQKDKHVFLAQVASDGRVQPFYDIVCVTMVVLYSHTEKIK